jgi:hypothetical protein
MTLIARRYTVPGFVVRSVNETVEPAATARPVSSVFTFHVPSPVSGSAAPESETSRVEPPETVRRSTPPTPDPLVSNTTTTSQVVPTVPSFVHCRSAPPNHEPQVIAASTAEVV